mmetsp:Transcript_2658/g.7524  ORF Transcript_2658/g.7524 Transcript_2658/m.7524 type:complete len:317 (-) Transcript_2658:2373-3323(-)
MFLGAFPRGLREELADLVGDREGEARAWLRQQFPQFRRIPFQFIDDEFRETPSARAQALQSAQAVEQQQALLFAEQLLVKGVDASSTDSPEQDIENTLMYAHTSRQPWNDRFWSSTGSDREDDTEHLTYQLKYPVSVLHSVKIQVYRARYQGGEPIYPSREVMFEVGPTLNSLHQATGWMPVRITCSPQTFLLPASACAGGFLRVNFRGKPQKQFEDMLHYLAIRRVWAFGWEAVSEHVLSHRILSLQSPKGSLAWNGTYAPAGAPRLSLSQERHPHNSDWNIGVGPSTASCGICWTLPFLSCSHELPMEQDQAGQ